MSDEEDFGWHALNYRTAHTVHAEAMYRDLVAFVERKETALRADRDSLRDALAALVGGIALDEWEKAVARSGRHVNGSLAHAALESARHVLGSKRA